MYITRGCGHNIQQTLDARTRAIDAEIDVLATMPRTRSKQRKLKLRGVANCVRRRLNALAKSFPLTRAQARAATRLVWERMMVAV